MNTPTIKTLNAIVMLTGVWLIITPLFFIDVNGSASAYWNSIIIGILAIIIGGIREWSTIGSSKWASVINTVLGIWLIVSPFILGFSNSTILVWNSIISGIVLGVFAILGATDHVRYSSPIIHHQV